MSKKYVVTLHHGCGDAYDKYVYQCRHNAVEAAKRMSFADVCNAVVALFDYDTGDKKWIATFYDGRQTNEAIGR